VAGCCECGNEHLGSVRGGYFLEKPSDCYHHKKDCVPTEFVTCVYLMIMPTLKMLTSISDVTSL
jgi:hypothetical protein